MSTDESPTVVTVDSHQHFWQPARGDYGWMPQDDPVLSRPYGPADLKEALNTCGIQQTVLVQAAPTVAETEYLLGIADATPHVAGVVGWIDFEQPSQRAILERLARHPKLLGVRPMIQDLPDDRWMLRDDVQWAYQALIDLDLTFDCLGFPRHIPHFATLLDRYPRLRAVLDHCMKPQLRTPDSFDAWRDGMAELAQTQAFVKLSGLLTEADTAVDADTVRRYVDHVIAAFGPERVMWGSDWPVLRLRAAYADWHAMARAITDPLDAADKDAIFGETAKRFYRLD
ncbi:amidohydrolase family protein [Sagittula salina]|uniref:Amidohydrolase family protein n=1 Tax=Sagittula salina TaxID=2820268 RepID=A0A940MMZ7_9RHOB|nr:amidohydrolase family protein [Sagittula salina]MBP0482518.1 amidohydrolase family protein [Sagittula salina]